jgi:hypothetical protein
MADIRVVTEKSSNPMGLGLAAVQPPDGNHHQEQNHRQIQPFLINTVWAGTFWYPGYFSIVQELVEYGKCRPWWQPKRETV